MSPLLWLVVGGASLYAISSVSAKPVKKPPLTIPKKPPPQLPNIDGRPAHINFPNPFNNGGQGSGLANTGISGPQPFSLPPLAPPAPLNLGGLGWLQGVTAPSPIGPQGNPTSQPFGLGANAGPATGLQPPARAVILGKVPVPTHAPHTRFDPNAMQLFG